MKRFVILLLLSAIVGLGAVGYKDSHETKSAISKLSVVKTIACVHYDAIVMCPLTLADQSTRTFVPKVIIGTPSLASGHRWCARPPPDIHSEKS